MRKSSTACLIVLTAFIFLFATSCTREFVCQCKMTYTGAPGLPEGEVREYPITDTKKKAESQCTASSAVYDEGGIHTVEECDLF